MFYKFKFDDNKYKTHDYATITWAVGREFFEKPEFGVYLKSLKNVAADHLMFTFEMPCSWRKKLADLGVVVIDTDPFGDFFFGRNRMTAKFLRECDYKVVAVTDCKDVIFQRDVFELVPDGEFAILTTEGMAYQESEWNMGEYFRFGNTGFKVCLYDLSQPVINGGVQIGTPKKLAEIYQAVANPLAYVKKEPVKLPYQFTDQVMLNIVYHDCLYKFDKQVKLNDPKFDNICITGEGIKEGFMDGRYRFENGAFLTKLGEPYYIVHQWDRTQYRDEIIETND